MQSNLFAKLFSPFASDEVCVTSSQKTTAVELDAAQLDQIVGGGGPHGGWAQTLVVVDGPHGGWL